MHAPLYRRRWVPLLLVLHACAVATIVAGALSTGPGDLHELMRTVAVSDTSPTSATRNDGEETRPAPEGGRGAVVRARADGPVPSGGQAPEPPTADLSHTSVSPAAAVWAQVVPAERLPVTSHLAAIVARGPPRGQALLSLVPPTRSAG